MPTPRPDARDFLPLSPQVFQVLLSLSDGPLHGYAILTDVGERTAGEMRLTASTLYDALARLVDRALIEECESRERREVAQRRRSYALTALGRDVAQAEARRLERLLAMARDKRMLRARR
jgi:DNA-binding PadR family transcriptional regulator